MIDKVLENLIEDPYPNTSRREPLPRKLKLPEGWTFHRIEIRVSKGASGQIRLMYLVNQNIRIIRLVWIYSHEQFVKRPAETELNRVITEILDF